MKQVQVLALGLLLLCGQAAAGPRLYIFDCGLINLDNLAIFNLEDHESPVRQMFVPCYLVEHPEGRLLFDVPRHKTVMHMPIDWPRINQFPEWFTVQADRQYSIENA